MSIRRQGPEDRTPGELELNVEVPDETDETGLAGDEPETDLAVHEGATADAPQAPGVPTREVPQPSPSPGARLRGAGRGLRPGRGAAADRAGAETPASTERGRALRGAPSPGRAGRADARPSAAAAAGDEHRYVDDRVSRIWVPLIVAAFVLVFLYPVFFGNGGVISGDLVTPEPTFPEQPLDTPPVDTPTDTTQSPTGSAAASPSGSPGASPTPVGSGSPGPSRTTSPGTTGSPAASP